MEFKFDSEEVTRELHSFIHKNFGRKCGLLSHEYEIHFDPSLEYHDMSADYVIEAGRVVHVGLRCLPTTERMMFLCRRAFGQSLRPFLRSHALVRKEDAERWHVLAVREGDEEISKRRRNAINRCTVEIITQVRLIDKKTRKAVTVETVNGNAFEAKEKAYMQLYGEEE